MATGRRKRSRGVNYEDLHNLSSVVLYDTGCKTKGKLFEVERIIVRRKCKFDHEYLLKWHGWPFEMCSWEPSANLTPDLLRSYEKPLLISDVRLQEASRQFATGILSGLKSPRSSPVYVSMDLDIWRYVTYRKGKPSEHKGHILLEKNDLGRLKFLPHQWWCYLNVHGEGLSIDFPMKIKPLLTWSAAHYCKRGGKLCKASRLPLEKLCITFVKKACNLENL